MSVDAYLNTLDLALDKPTAQQLLSQVDASVTDENRALSATGDDGAPSQGLTSRMMSWYANHIATFREPALAQLETQARSIKVRGVEGILLPTELDKIEREKARRTVEVLENFNQQNRQNLDDLAVARREYEDMRTKKEGGRHAKVPSLWLEIALLIPVVFGPEALLNLASFRQSPWIHSDLMAWGATLSVGAGFAVAAYCWGIWMRRFNYYVRPDDYGHKRSGTPYLIIGNLALFYATGLVGAVRYFYLLDRIVQSRVMGVAPPNLFVSIGVLLFGNLIWFVFGMWITFMLNDPNPEFSDLRRELLRKERSLKPIFKRFVDRKLIELTQSARLKREEAEKRASLMESEPGYSELREQIARVSAKDTQVVGVLQEFRTNLVSRMRSKGLKVEFEMRELSSDRGSPTQKVSLDGFSTLPLHLSWSK